MSNLYHNIPAELKALKQWVLWRYEETDGSKPTKVPYGIDWKHASVSDPATWCSFEEALAAAPHFSGIGFVFTDHDPYCGIDLDHLDPVALKPEDYQRNLAVQQDVYARFGSYAERSPSGKGLHIIIRAILPAGRRRGGIEIYSKQRFFTFTGDVFNDAPIQDRQGLAEILYNQMGAHVEQYYYDGEAEEKYTDQQVIDAALGATNGDKFAKLLTEEWRELYPDAGGGNQSSADFAFIDIIAFYTQNRRQITRIFHNSPLGQRRKAKRVDYVNGMINKSFDRMLPPLDMAGLYNAIEEQKAVIAAQPAPTQQVETEAPVVMYPRGLMGDIARFIYSASPLPVHEISIAAAIGLMAGICGRSYNVSGTGVNMYVLCLAHTGRGKEAMSSGIGALINACTNLSGGNAMQTPSLAKFMGPSFIASAQGLHKELSVQPSFLSIIGEFGLRMQSLASNKASPNDLALKAMLLDLYNKSGRTNVLGKMSYSDTQKNVATIQAPAFSILAESTPSTFLKIVDEDLISSGLLPRFLTVVYEGKRNDLNKNAKYAQPAFELTERLGKLAVQSHMLSGQGTPTEVQFEPDALVWADEFGQFATDMINANTKSVVLTELWSRAYIKLVRLSALVAIGANPISPVVTRDDIAWAYAIIDRDIKWYKTQFEAGTVGEQNVADNLRQMKDMFRLMFEYNTKSYEEFEAYGVKRDPHNQHIIPGWFFTKKLSGVASFRTDRLGSRNAIKNTLAEFVSNGTVVELSKADIGSKLGMVSGKYYMLKEMGFFDPGTF